MKVEAMIVALGLGACSFIGVRGPPDEPRPARFDCSKSSVAPTVDLVGAGIFTALTVLSLVPTQASGDGGTNDGRAFTMILVVPALIYGLSAWAGFDRISSCRDASWMPPARAVSTPTHEEIESRHAAARSMLRQAIDAANAGDCAHVVTFSASVARLDAAFHAATFVVDPNLARCLSPPSAVPTSTEPDAR
jgi:hypothetical protein